MNKHMHTYRNDGHREFMGAMALVRLIEDMAHAAHVELCYTARLRSRNVVEAFADALACAAREHARAASRADRLHGTVVYVNGRPLVDATARLKQLHGAAHGRCTQAAKRGQLPSEPKSKFEKNLTEALSSLLD